MWTFSPTFTSPVTLVLESRLISQRSFPFCTVMTESVTSRTGPVTSYVFAPAANTELPPARQRAANRLRADLVFMCWIRPPRSRSIQGFCEDYQRSAQIRADFEARR